MAAGAHQLVHCHFHHWSTHPELAVLWPVASRRAGRHSHGHTLDEENDVTGPPKVQKYQIKGGPGDEVR